MVLDRGFYSATSISLMFNARISFCIPIPTTVKWQGKLIDEYREAVEMPEHAIHISEDGKEALYGMTILDKVDECRVWKHL
jgi:hypothetical protein